MESLLVVMVSYFLSVGAYHHSRFRKDNFCTTPDNTNGVCINIKNCQYLWNLFQSNDMMPSLDETNYLLKSRCGKSGRIPKVCCKNKYRKSRIKKNLGKQFSKETSIDKQLKKEIIMGEQFPKEITTIEGEELCKADIDKSPINKKLKDLDEGDYCETPVSTYGTCMDIKKCTYLWDIMSDINNRTYCERLYLLRSKCGISRKKLIFCCNTPEKLLEKPKPTILAENKINSLYSDCTTPDGKNGTCIGIHECTSLQSILDGPRPVSMIHKTLLRESECISSDQYSVCCPKDELFSSQVACGKMKPSDRIVNGEKASIYDFPWTVIIEYQRDINSTEYKFDLVCGGSLISSRYVVTAAHCYFPQYKNPSVRIGEHNTTTIVDCQENICNEPLLRVRIEKFIVHSNYSQKDYFHDIALIRLEKTVQFNDFVSPICLPTSDITETFTIPGKLFFYVCGWGQTEENVLSDVKLKIQIPHADFNNCSQYYNEQGKQIIESHQLCAGGKKKKDSCKGDSGGPLMYDRKTIYELVGVVSYGTKDCTKNKPAVYTKVISYVNWIKNEMSLSD